MMRIEQCGFMTTLQDCGRTHWLAWGMHRSGAMDVLAARLANMLVLNEPCTSVLEITQSPHRIYTDQSILVAFTGGGLQPVCNGQALPLYTPLCLPANSYLELSVPRPGYRLYMAVAGGFAAEKHLGSYSTDLLLQSGGYAGRPLRKGDVLRHLFPLTAMQQRYMALVQQGALMQPPLPEMLPQHAPLAVMPGPEWHLLRQQECESLLSQNYTVQMQSNRMAYRLRSTWVPKLESKEIISSPVTEGTIQLTPSGEWMILMADGQTIGGYPRILQVSAAHLSRLAQCKPGEQIRFRLASVQEATSMLRKQQSELQHLAQWMQQWCGST